MPFRKMPDGETIWVTPEEEEERKRRQSELSDIQYHQDEYESQPVNILIIKELIEELKMVRIAILKVGGSVRSGLNNIDMDELAASMKRREE